MKGVSAVIAIILILMITVALAATAYVWFVTIFQGITEEAGEKVTSVGEALGTAFAVENAKNTSIDNIAVSIRNTGSVNIALGNVATYVDDELKTHDGNTTLTPGQVKLINVDSGCNQGDILKVTEATGSSYTRSITCS